MPWLLLQKSLADLHQPTTAKCCRQMGWAVAIQCLFHRIGFFCALPSRHKLHGDRQTDTHSHTRTQKKRAACCNNAKVVASQRRSAPSKSPCGWVYCSPVPCGLFRVQGYDYGLFVSRGLGLNRLWVRRAFAPARRSPHTPPCRD